MGYKKIILIVDDKAVNRQILRHFLAEEYEIIEAGDGDEALKILHRRDDISAVLLDLRMPVMDGFQVLESMRSHANMAAVPVLAVSKDNEDETQVKALSMGAWDFVGKPYKPLVIKQRLYNMIQLNEAKEILAFELTKLVHGEEEATKAKEASHALFAGGANNANMPTVTVTAEDFPDGELDIISVLVKAGLCDSRGDGRRNIQQGGVSVADEKVTDISTKYTLDDFKGEGLIIRRGKKKFAKVVAE